MPRHARQPLDLVIRPLPGRRIVLQGGTQTEKGAGLPHEHRARVLVTRRPICVVGRDGSRLGAHGRDRALGEDAVAHLFHELGGGRREVRLGEHGARWRWRLLGLLGVPGAVRGRQQLEQEPARRSWWSLRAGSAHIAHTVLTPGRPAAAGVRDTDPISAMSAAWCWSPRAMSFPMVESSVSMGKGE